jgi:hypothetical protein
MSEQRSYSISIEDRTQYLYVRLSAEQSSVEMLVDSMNEISQALRATGHRKLLLDRRYPHMKSLLRHMMAARLAANVLPKGMQVAVLHLESNRIGAVASIAAAAAAAGMNIKVFKNEPDAATWLLDGESAKQSSA